MSMACQAHSFTALTRRPFAVDISCNPKTKWPETRNNTFQLEVVCFLRLKVGVISTGFSQLRVLVFNRVRFWHEIQKDFAFNKGYFLVHCFLFHFVLPYPSRFDMPVHSPYLHLRTYCASRHPHSTKVPLRAYTLMYRYVPPVHCYMPQIPYQQDLLGLRISGSRAETPSAKPFPTAAGSQPRGGWASGHGVPAAVRGGGGRRGATSLVGRRLGSPGRLPPGAGG